jgi:hypothetical protein
MAVADRGLLARSSVAVLAGLLGAACAAPTYAPCPVELDGPLPADAFAQCQRVLLERYGSLAVADAAAFRLQTDWLATDNPPRERRATVFHEPEGLVVVVETRALHTPLFGLPKWSTLRGDAAAERELAGHLQKGLSPPR